MPNSQKTFAMSTSFILASAVVLLCLLYIGSKIKKRDIVMDVHPDIDIDYVPKNKSNLYVNSKGELVGKYKYDHLTK